MSAWTRIGPVAAWIWVRITCLVVPIAFLFAYAYKCFTSNILVDVNEIEGDVDQLKLFKPWFFSYALMSVAMLVVYFTLFADIMESVTE